ncbi:hypothetical protein INR49_024613 [Caranx melampygus]|nr:hypothetical protein INR49_024613 [Caranx melampygus]
MAETPSGKETERCSNEGVVDGVVLLPRPAIIRTSRSRWRVNVLANRASPGRGGPRETTVEKLLWTVR